MAEGRLTVSRALREHWPEYLMEAWGLGAFMVSAGLVAILLQYPGSLMGTAMPDGGIRLALMGLVMGLTAVGIICSPWGKRSGAHINPAVTLTFLRLSKVDRVDAAFYILAQLLGGLAGILLVRSILGTAFSVPQVDFVDTVPGKVGVPIGYLTEVAMSGGLMLVAVKVFRLASPGCRWFCAKLD